MAHKFHNLITSKHFAAASAAIVFAFMLFLGEVFLQTQKREAENKRNIGAVSYAATLRARIERELNALLYLNSGLGSYLVVRNSSIKGKELDDILAVLHKSSRHVRNFGIAIGYRLTYVYPAAGNEKAIVLYYPDQPAQWPVIKNIVASGKPALAGPVDLVQGGQGLIYRVPLFIGDKYWGLLSTVIDSDSLLKTVFAELDDGSYEYALRGKDGLGNNGEGILGDLRLFSAAGVVVQEIDIPGGRWAIAVKARGDERLGNLTLVARLISLLLSSLMAWMLYALIRNRSELAHLVMFDSLTGLPNRRLFEDRAQMAFARQQRHPEQMCALMFLDMDGFKSINDTYGHKAGDAVLHETAERARATVRANDTVARWGGDEFIVLLENVSQSKLEQLAQRLRETIEAPIDFEGQSLTVGVSIGLAIYPEAGTDLDAILKFADREMYFDKSSRKTSG